MARKFTTEYFNTKAKEVHGDKYDYSKVNYVNATEKVCIVCPEHGEFWQNPTSYLKGFGCRKCSAQTLSKKVRKDKTDVIAEAKAVHGEEKQNLIKMLEKNGFGIIMHNNGRAYEDRGKFFYITAIKR